MNVILLFALLFQSPSADGIGRTTCVQTVVPNRVEDYLVGQAICVGVKLGMDMDSIQRILSDTAICERCVQGWGKGRCVVESTFYLRYGIYLCRKSIDWSELHAGPMPEHLDGGIGP